MDRGETTVKGMLRCTFVEEGVHPELRSWTNQDSEDASGYMNRSS